MDSVELVSLSVASCDSFREIHKLSKCSNLEKINEVEI